MARIEERARKNGQVSYRVQWRLGGDRSGPWQSETFEPGQAKLARKFAADVEHAGHQWPANYVPGRGYVSADEFARARAADGENQDTSTPFAVFAHTWVEHLTGVEKRTRADYRRDIDLHMIEAFGDLDVTDPRSFDRHVVARWVNALHEGVPDPDDPTLWLKKPKSVKTIANLHGLLYSILQSAVEADPPLRASNPCARTQLPRLDDGEDGEEMVFLSPEEFAVILAVLHPDARALAEILVGTGLRYSEATALQVRDLELLGDKPCLWVRRAWRRGEDNKYRLGPPKTRKSRRRVRLTAAQVLLLLPFVVGKGREEFVFTSTQGGMWRHSKFFGRRWLPALYRAMRCEYHRGIDGLKKVNTGGVHLRHLVCCGCPGMLEKVPRVHDLRHTHVAWLIAAGTREAAIQKRLGHESITTTIDRYGHLMPEVDDDLVAGLETIMGRVGERGGENEKAPPVVARPAAG